MSSKRQDEQIDLGQGVRGGLYEQMTPLEHARQENRELRARQQELRALGELERENEGLRREVAQAEEIIAAVTEMWKDGADAPTQEDVAERLGIDKRKVAERLAPYPGLWRRITAPRG